MHVDLSHEELATVLRCVDRSLIELSAERRSAMARAPEDLEDIEVLEGELSRLQGLRQKLTQVDQAGVGDTDSGGQLEVSADPS